MSSKEFNMEKIIKTLSKRILTYVTAIEVAGSGGLWQINKNVLSFSEITQKLRNACRITKKYF